MRTDIARATAAGPLRGIGAGADLLQRAGAPGWLIDGSAEGAVSIATLKNLFSPTADISYRSLSTHGLLDAGASTTTFEADAMRALREAFDAPEAALPERILGAVQYCASFVADAADPALPLAARAQTEAALAAVRAASPDTTQAALVIGDVSGIQPFVHGIASKRAARALRARSFYVQMISELASRFVAEQCGVTAVNIIVASGGGFTVVIPASGRDRVALAQAAIDRALFELHGPSPGIVLGAAPIDDGAGHDATFAEAVAAARASVGAAKWRRLAESASALGVFEPRGDGGPVRACRSCGADAPDARDDEDGRICALCASLEELGRELTHCRYLSLDPAEHEGAARGDWSAIARRLGYAVALHERPPAASTGSTVLALDAAALSDMPSARLFPARRPVPSDDAMPLDFEEIAEFAKGKHFLGVVKADVDDLGLRLRELAEGGGGGLTPERFGAFSRMLSLFFEGHVASLAELPEFGGMYIVFAGGDDLMAIGPWDQAIAFITRVRDDFALWTGGNDAYHLSAGIVVGHPSRPVMRTLDEAEDALSAAKKRPGKNAVCMFDTVFGWDDFTQMQTWRDNFIELVRDGRDGGAAARSVLQRVQQLPRTADDKKRRYGSHIFRMHYYLRRYASQHKKGAPLFDRLEQKMLDENGLEMLRTAARLAEFATVTGEEN